MPEDGATYAVPQPLARDGASAATASTGSRCSGRPSGCAARRLVVCHLGGGCSVTAVLDGRSVDTTMGFTPLEGVPMATRSGSVDPGRSCYLLRERPADARRARPRARARVGPARPVGRLRPGRGAASARPTRRRGSRSPSSAAGSRARSAAMAAALGGLDALVFTGGIGEHSAAVRAAVCERLAFAGVELDAEPERGRRPGRRARGRRRARPGGGRRGEGGRRRSACGAGPARLGPVGDPAAGRGLRSRRASRPCRSRRAAGRPCRSGRRAGCG